MHRCFTVHLHLCLLLRSALTLWVQFSCQACPPLSCDRYDLRTGQKKHKRNQAIAHVLEYCSSQHPAVKIESIAKTPFFSHTPLASLPLARLFSYVDSTQRYQPAHRSRILSNHRYLRRVGYRYSDWLMLSAGQRQIKSKDASLSSRKPGCGVAEAVSLLTKEGWCKSRICQLFCCCWYSGYTCISDEPRQHAVFVTNCQTAPQEIDGG